MLSSHLLSEVETIAQRVIILRRGHLGLAKKLSDLETDSIILVEVRGPSDQVANALRGVDGVTQVTIQGLGDGLHSYEVRTRRSEDLREQIFRVAASHNWPLRRLDMRRRHLQDRWNEINNLDESVLPAAVASGGGDRREPARFDGRNAIMGRPAVLRGEPRNPVHVQYDHEEIGRPRPQRLDARQRGGTVPARSKRTDVRAVHRPHRGRPCHDRLRHPLADPHRRQDAGPRRGPGRSDPLHRRRLSAVARRRR